MSALQKEIDFCFICTLITLGLLEINSDNSFNHSRSSQ